MLLSGFTSPRRLALLAVATFIAAILFIQTTSYSGYLPKYDIPGFSPSKSGEQKSSLEEDQQAPGRIETPSEEGLKVPVANAGGKDGADTIFTASLSSYAATISTASPSSSGSSGGDTILTASPSSSSSSSEADFIIVTGSGHQFRVYPDKTTDHDAATATTADDAPATTIDPEATPTLTSNSTTVEPVDTSEHEDKLSQHMSYKQAQDTIQALIKSWQPVTIEGHEPPYEVYRDKDYDPNLWEGFGYDNDFYINNGIKKLQEENAGVQPAQNLPYPAYNTLEWKSQWRGEFVPCESARGKLLNDSAEDLVRTWPALPNGFPNFTIGDANATGIVSNQCFDRYNRFGPYGYGQGERGPIDGWERPVEKLDWSGVRWGQLQDQCLIANKERYAETARQPSNLAPGVEMPKEDANTHQGAASATGFQYHSRTAILLRTWEGYDYTENDLQSIRAMITELSLLSGGEYQVFLLVNVKDPNALIFDSQSVYDDMLRRSVPRELQDFAILWHENLCEEWYPKVGEWGADWQQYMPVQWFSETHPEFDFVWNWEPDTRYTGNHYQFLEAVAGFAKEVPRKYLWERSQRFYIPAAGYGDYHEFVQNTVRTVETGMRENTVTPIWGPQPYSPNEQTLLGPTPPSTEKDDQFTWGRHEEADLITLSPIFDPRQTEWKYKDKIWNFIVGIRPHFTEGDPEDKEYHHPDFANIPRRASLGTLVRLSRKQLHAMHLANIAGRAMANEMWPATIALQHGLKAVYVPHPIWTDRNWPNWYADAILNADANKTAQWGQQADSVYNPDRLHNLAGLSYAGESGFPTVLYRRWLGFPAYEDEPVSPIDGLGGKGFEHGGFIVDLGNSDSGAFVGGKGRMCLPPMLLHPVLKVQETDEPGEREFMEPGG